MPFTTLSGLAIKVPFTTSSSIEVENEKPNLSIRNPLQLHCLLAADEVDQEEWQQHSRSVQ